MAVLLVRHAEAGERDQWDGPDDVRPLTAEGAEQADRLVGLFGDFDIKRVLSSPYLRCTQTVAPLGAALRVAVEPSDDLAEGAAPAALELVRSLLDGEDVVLCTHGDVMEEVLDALLVGRTAETEKGATWVLGPTSARPLPPPGLD